MESSVTLTIIALSILLAFTAAKPVKENKLIGTWRLVGTEANGNSKAKVINRTWTFKDNNRFEGKIYLPGGSRPFNEGIYLLVDDTTLVTIHRNIKGNIIKSANYYNFHIQNDSLHFYGNFLRPDPNNSKGILLLYIDELWVKLP